MSKIRVLLADDHTILRVGLRAFLRYHADIEVIDEAENGKEALSKVEELGPDIVLMDIAMPGMNGIEATRLIRERFPETKVLILSQYSDSQYVLPLLRSGASGFILKDALGTDLLAALRTVASGRKFLCPSIAGLLIDEIRSPGANNNGDQEALTPRELEILQCIAAGQTNPQIAEELTISVNTVEWHRSNLMSKLDVHTAGELVRYAMQHGLVAIA
jgi:DNA-binding NarL/FixJ family response regulator